MPSIIHVKVRFNFGTPWGPKLFQNFFDKKLFSYLNDSSSCDFEFGPLQEITKDRQLKAFHHSGFWQCMDNVRERDYLNELIKQNLAPWIIW